MDGNVVTTVHVVPAAVWFGKSQFTWADVGGVGVRPELRSQGYGTQAMTDVVNWLRETDCAVSRIGGLIRFYERFGYRPFPRQYVEFPVPRELRAGASRVSFLDTLTPAREDGGIVRPFDPERDMTRVCEIAEEFSRHRTGSRVFRPSAQDGPFGRHTIVYDEDGNVRGVASYRLYPGDISAFEAPLTV